MARLDSTRGYWSRVRDPETDEYIDLDDDVDREVAERLADEYSPLSLADEDSDENDDDDDDGDELDEMLKGTVGEVEDAIESGDYDDLLGEIADRDDRITVQEAVEDRRDELESEDE